MAFKIRYFDALQFPDIFWNCPFLFFLFCLEALFCNHKYCETLLYLDRKPELLYSSWWMETFITMNCP